MGRDGRPIGLEALYGKRLRERENTLETYVEDFQKHVVIAEDNFMTICDRCLWCIKKGSIKEYKLAAQFIGLLVMTTSSVESTHEVYQELSKEICLFLKSKSDSTELLNCLAMVTFFGALESEETQTSMQIIWDLIIQHKKDSNIDKVAVKPKELPAAINSWLFMLTTLDAWRLSYKRWRGATTYFLDKLQDEEEDDNDVCTMACLALCLMLELDCFDKFRDVVGDSVSTTSTIDANKDVVADEMMNKIGNKRCRLVVDTNSETYSISKLAAKFIQDGEFSKIVKTIGKMDIIISPWSQFIQYVFLKKFIGDGFDTHLSENEVLRDVFEFRQPHVPDLIVQESMLNFDKVVVQYSLLTHKEVKEKSIKRIFRSPCSRYSKASTRLLAKKRDIVQGHKTGILVEEQELDS